MINSTKATSTAHLYTSLCEVKKWQEKSVYSMSMDTF